MIFETLCHPHWLHAVIAPAAGLTGGLLASGGPNPVSHIIDQRWESVPGYPGLTLMSKHVFVQLLAAALLVLTLPAAFGQRTLVPRGLRNALEAVCVYIRETVARPQLGPHTDRFIHYLWTVFFFVLGCNLLGLVPFSATPTSNIWVTATLAAMTMTMTVVNGLRLSGLAYVEHFFPGPPALKPLIGLLEITGIFTKGFALAVRLFANMLAGHVLLDVLISLIGTAAKSVGTLGGLGVALIVVPACIALNLLELFVACLQAFVFTFLTALFIGQAVNIAHHDDHHPAGHDDHSETAHAKSGGPVAVPAKP